MSRSRFLQRLLLIPPIPVAVFIGLLLSLWSMWQNPVLNDDAYYYLHGAQVFQQQGVGALYRDYPWATYSLLIGVLDWVIPGDMLVAARLLDLALLSLLVAVFVALSQRLCAHRHAGWLAAAVILLYPQINELRFALVRDFGFCAFSLWSLLLLLKYRDESRLLTAIGWALTLLIATAFRIEALFLAAFAPLSLLQKTHQRRGLVLYGLLFALAVGALLVCAAIGVDLLDRMQYAWRYYLMELRELPAQLQGNIQSLIRSALTPDNPPGSNNTLMAILLLFFYAISLVLVFCQALGFPLNLVLLYAAWRNRWRPTGGWREPVGCYLMITGTSLLLFMLLMHFVTERYTLLLCLLLLVQVPLIIDRWADVWRKSKHRRLYQSGMALLAALMLIDSVISFGTYPTHLPQALAWLQEHPDEGNKLLTNSPYLAYGSGRIDNYDAVQKPVRQLLSDMQQGDVMAVALTKTQSAERLQLDEQKQLTLLTRFLSKRGGEVRIYRY